MSRPPPSVEEQVFYPLEPRLRLFHNQRIETAVSPDSLQVLKVLILLHEVPVNE
jgi:hypothetical protein